MENIGGTFIQSDIDEFNNHFNTDAFKLLTKPIQKSFTESALFQSAFETTARNELNVNALMELNNNVPRTNTYKVILAENLPRKEATNNKLSEINNSTTIVAIQKLFDSRQWNLDNEIQLYMIMQPHTYIELNHVLIQ